MNVISISTIPVDMEDYQLRMIDEARELRERISKLEQDLENKYPTPSPMLHVVESPQTRCEEKELMCGQLWSMREYLSVLRKRISFILVP